MERWRVIKAGGDTEEVSADRVEYKDGALVFSISQGYGVEPSRIYAAGSWVCADRLEKQKVASLVKSP